MFGFTDGHRQKQHRSQRYDVCRHAYLGSAMPARCMKMTHWSGFGGSVWTNKGGVKASLSCGIIAECLCEKVLKDIG